MEQGVAAALPPGQNSPALHGSHAAPAVPGVQPGSGSPVSATCPSMSGGSPPSGSGGGGSPPSSVGVPLSPPSVILSRSNVVRALHAPAPTTSSASTRSL